MQKGHVSAAHLTPNLRTGVSGGFPDKKVNSPFLFGIQKPPVYKGKIASFGSSQNLICSNKNGDPRAAIYASRSLHIWPLMEFCDSDTAVGLWKTGNNNINEIFVVSVYMDILLPEVWPAAFERLLDSCERKKVEVLICSDTNAGSRKMYKRDEAWEDYIFIKNLTI